MSPIDSSHAPPRGGAGWPRPRSPAGFRPDGPLLCLLVAALACSAWFVFFDAAYESRIRVFWLAQVPLDALLAVAALRVRRLTGGPRRRFWTALGWSAALWTTGDATQSALTLGGQATARVNGGVTQTTCFTIGVATMVVALLAHPSAARTGRQRLAYWLDAATVLVGGAVLAWCFLVSSATPDKIDVAGTLIGTGALLTAGYAATKTVLRGSPPMTTIAAAPMVGAILLHGIGLFAVPSSGDHRVAEELMLLRLLPSFLVLAGPRIQELQALADPGVLSGRRVRRYSPLPYASIIAVLSALLITLPGGVNRRLWGVVIGAVAVTLLVVARQVVAFHDNISLIKRLDATLLELREHEKRLRDQAMFDGLTRLANRAVLGDAVTNALGSQSGFGLALLLIDLDDFKTVNDSLGHPAGDALLIKVARVLRTSTPAKDLVARLGGDEFAVLLRDVTPEQAASIAERILGKLSSPIEIDGHELAVRASIGLAVATPEDDLNSLLRNADIAMYEAKNSGKGGYATYIAAMGAKIRETATLRSQLRDAIGTPQLFLRYQPIVELSDGRITAVEALLRWCHPERGLVAPDEFIPVAERTGMIVSLGEWVLREACRQGSEWRRTHGDRANITMNVNVTGRQLQERGFAERVAAALADSDLPPANLAIEVTEDAVLQDETAIANLHDLRALGVKLALDDFGTAASSLGLLLTCPVTTLKLDRSFVESITTVTRQRAVATAVIEMANALGLTAVAEGVETPEQAELLQRLSYQYAQGFLFSEPLPPAELARRWMSSGEAGSSPRRYEPDPDGSRRRDRVP